jgi:hypothetical protein
LEVLLENDNLKGLNLENIHFMGLSIRLNKNIIISHFI